jgi:hypothetical protein
MQPFHPQFMDRHLQSALANWPKEPRAYDWLALDARGRWRLQGEPVRHEGWNRLIGANYQSAECGCWYYLHGEQKIFVSLAYTPWVYTFKGRIIYDQRGQEAFELKKVWLDENGVVVLETERGPGTLSDENLEYFIDHICDADGKRLSEEIIERQLQQAETFPAGKVIFHFLWHEQICKVHKVDSDHLPSMTYFKKDPKNCSAIAEH